MELKRIRIDLGMTMKQVSSEALITEGYYCLIENRKRRPTPNVALRIAQALGMTTEQIWETFYGEADGESRCG